MSDERGQAALLAVLLIGIAAVVVVGLRETQVHILEFASLRSAGEAAVESATAVVADAYAAEIAAANGTRDMRAVLSAPALRQTARIAADDVSARNGGPTVDDVDVTCHDGVVDVTTALRGVVFRARFSGPACSRR